MGRTGHKWPKTDVWNSVKLAASIIIWIVAWFYAYGALVHVMNMLSTTGLEWRSAPVEWQALDVLYLIIDVVVVVDCR